ncbi:putative AUT2/APG4/ATG4 cysteine peptidase [Leishmania major strain Friedlin]|uniref:Cysteine protease n=1 Tax=Leishmania major TaxID=5664 RepID=Q4Q4N3_LEIMA|nr:putative AUT2/APG4/ATG4 cysteine peptidase [Leishmania major strain Friedlin]CAG9580539.1 AUT2/APG4/ATG4_cysteine_peptidase_-_putative [Leishmania major strain Friedlin]CAJ08920.1 putative AUT2/APG4/ATG4 cysteine peptidase [Leishmania major strain Friedlin]|eukprot:XP_001685715.1 putative AUT2/APG4/ATG4 cysteine peptidase [Leishmania major strain Friedlin]
MGTNAKVAEKTPCVDSGSLFKWWLNPSKIFRTPNRKLKNTTPVVVVGSGSHSGDGTTEFVKVATKKLLYFSYRNCFPPLPSGSTTDTHWGCLVRTTQMLVGTCLLRYHCKGAYVLPEADNAELKERISRLFMDVPSAPLGIHKAEDEAHKNSVKYASMLSPTEAGMAIAAALIAFRAQGGDVPFTFCCESRHIDEPAVMAKLLEGQHVVLIIPVVLGIAPMSDQYELVMLKILDVKACCGIAGGFKQASLYMFGHQGRSVFFMDPHYVQNAYTSSRTVGTLEGSRGELRARRFDPCMVLGFYLHTPEDYRVFAEELAVANSLVVFPLISFGRRPREGTTLSEDRVVSVAESAESITLHEKEKPQRSRNPLAADGEHARSSNSISSPPS